MPTLSWFPVSASITFDPPSSTDGLIEHGGIYYSKESRVSLVIAVTTALSDSIPVKDLFELIVWYAVSPAEYVSIVCASEPKTTPYVIGRVAAGGRESDGSDSLVFMTHSGAVNRLKLARGGAMISVTSITTALKMPQGLAPDPRTQDGSFFVCNGDSVYRVSGRDGSTQLIAGSMKQQPHGCSDGHATTEATFRNPNGLASTIDPVLGPVLFVCDFSNCRLRRVVLDTNQVMTVGGGGGGSGSDQSEGSNADGLFGTSQIPHPEFCCWDRGPHLTANQHQQRLYITSSGRALHRYDCDTGQLSTIALPPNTDERSWAGIKCLPTGQLVAACIASGRIYIIDATAAVPAFRPLTGADKRTTSTASFERSLAKFKFNACICVEVVDDECAIYVTDFSSSAIRRIQLSDTYFC